MLGLVAEGLGVALDPRPDPAQRQPPRRRHPAGRAGLTPRRPRRHHRRPAAGAGGQGHPRRALRERARPRAGPHPDLSSAASVGRCENAPLELRIGAGRTAVGQRGASSVGCSAFATPACRFVMECWQGCAWQHQVHGKRDEHLGGARGRAPDARGVGPTDRPFTARDVELPPGPHGRWSDGAGAARPGGRVSVPVRDRDQQRRTHRTRWRRPVAVGTAPLWARLRRRPELRAADVRDAQPSPAWYRRGTQIRVSAPAPERSRPRPRHVLLPRLGVRADRDGDRSTIRPLSHGRVVRCP